MGWGRFLFLGSLFVLFSCSKVKAPSPRAAGRLTLQNVNCSAGDFGLLSTEISKATNQVLSCLKTHNRVQDAANYQKIIANQTVNIQCVNDRKNTVATAYHGFHPLAPGMGIQMNKFKTRFSYDEFMKTLTHETIHWLGYLHYQDVDLAYIVENCCFAEVSEYGKSVRQKACGLFRFQNKSDFFNPSYIQEFNEVLVDAGIDSIGFHTVLRSAMQAAIETENSKKIERVDRILNAPVNSYFAHLDLVKDKSNFSSWAKPELINYMLLTNILKHSNISDVAGPNQFRQNIVIDRFFYTDESRQKLRSLTLISDFLEPVIRNQGFSIRFTFRNLNRHRDEICSGLDRDEAEIITDILSRITIYAVDKISFPSKESRYFSILKEPIDPDVLPMLMALREFCKPAPAAH